LYVALRMTFQRNQPPTEQKIAMAFVMVLECVSRNLRSSVYQHLGEWDEQGTYCIFKLMLHTTAV
jgi:hypothetical protein